MSYAVIKTGGKQYRVEEGQTLLVERLPDEPGATIDLTPLLLAGDGDPVLDAAKLAKAPVKAEIVGHERGKKLRKGSVWPTDAYVSTHKAIANKLTGDLWLVTVREESLWLVAALRRPRHDGRAWTAAANVVPVVDITELAGELEFDSGAGVNVERMAMSLQTPRGLTAGDVVAAQDSKTTRLEGAPNNSACLH